MFGPFINAEEVLKPTVSQFVLLLHGFHGGERSDHRWGGVGKAVVIISLRKAWHSAMLREFIYYYYFLISKATSTTQLHWFGRLMIFLTTLYYWGLFFTGLFTISLVGQLFIFKISKKSYIFTGPQFFHPGNSHAATCFCQFLRIWGGLNLMIANSLLERKVSKKKKKKRKESKKSVYKSKAAVSLMSYQNQAVWPRSL